MIYLPSSLSRLDRIVCQRADPASERVCLQVDEPVQIIATTAGVLLEDELTTMLSNERSADPNNK